MSVLHILWILSVTGIGISLPCDYKITPLTETFGGKVTGLKIDQIDKECATKLKQEAFMYRFLLFSNQNLQWQDQVYFTELLGTPFTESSSINRKKHAKIPDPRLGYFSNDPTEGITSVGIEGWHVDGNVAESPHMFTLIYCISNNKNGPTLVVPLKEVVDMLTDIEREYLEKLFFVSGHNSSIIHPLLYKERNRKDDTIMLALGKLSGQYLEEMEDGSKRVMSIEETKAVQDLLEVKILSSNRIYSHQYEPGDMLMLYNPSVAHIAGPGSQTPREISGLRLMSRTTVLGEHRPTKKSNMQYECSNLTPFESGYCLFSLKDSVYYPRVGVFDSQDNARKHCTRVNKYADLAVLPTVEWNDKVKGIILHTGVPHWINAKNPQYQDVYWEGIEEKSNVLLWDVASGQPNDCDMLEDCVIVGPYGHWFDVPCSGPKTKQGSDPGPVMTWENGKKKMFNIYPLCGVEMKYLNENDPYKVI
ncbi:uncharacterized protein LOC123558892 [Mercenaria mercenaria]|uniref:uncharacterized protein LOC123558892 n=1 Tax=Mercenaria mercenaria TaxID=6596 RepID=UPI00234F5DD8|nr:uncharacterized protein LOC123558892 [Mercenaria mercenaria]